MFIYDVSVLECLTSDLLAFLVKRFLPAFTSVVLRIRFSCVSTDSSALVRSAFVECKPVAFFQAFFDTLRINSNYQEISKKSLLVCCWVAFVSFISSLNIYVARLPRSN